MNLLTTTQTAAELGIDESRVRRIAATRGLGQKIGPVWVFTPEEVDAMRVRHPGRPKPTA